MEEIKLTLSDKKIEMKSYCWLREGEKPSSSTLWFDPLEEAPRVRLTCADLLLACAGIYPAFGVRLFNGQVILVRPKNVQT